jgi:hypothetical protein
VNGNAYVLKSPEKCPIERKILTQPKNDALNTNTILVELLQMG